MSAGRYWWCLRRPVRPIVTIDHSRGVRLGGRWFIVAEALVVRFFIVEIRRALSTFPSTSPFLSSSSTTSGLIFWQKDVVEVWHVIPLRRSIMMSDRGTVRVVQVVYKVVSFLRVFRMFIDC